MINEKRKKFSAAQQKLIDTTNKLVADALQGNKVSLEEIREAVEEIRAVNKMDDICNCRGCGKEFKHKEEEQRVLVIIAALKGHKYTEHRENGGKQIPFCHKCWTKMGLDEFVS